MSVKVMSAVFDRYPNGAGEMVLALALADHAHDDGSHIFPGVSHLAAKTRQSERAVQYQLRRMQDSGWLILVGNGDGGRSRVSEYRICLEWIKGAEIALTVKGANDGTKGCKSAYKRVNPASPAMNPKITIKEPSEHAANSRSNTFPELAEVPETIIADYMEVRKAKRAGKLTQSAVDGLCREAEKAGITPADALRVCCERGWQGFMSSWYVKSMSESGTPARNPWAGAVN